MKKRIFFGFSAGLGPFIRCLPIMNGLRDRGCTIAYNAIDNVTEKMARLGYELIEVPWITGQDESLLPEMTPTWFDADQYWGALGYKDANWVRKLWLAYADCVGRFKPDLIIGDFSIESRVTAMLLGVPHIGITQACYHPSGKGGRLRYWQPMPEDKPSATTEVNEVLTILKLPTISRLEDLFLGDTTIIPGFPEFDVLENEPTNTRFVGPILWNGAFPAAGGIEKSGMKGNIFLYPGRFEDFVSDAGLKMTRLLVEYFAHTRFNLYVSCGNMSDTKRYFNPSTLPSNITFLDWTAMEDAYRNSMLVIHHGGHGSCMASFMYGTPSLAIPTHSEREYNARSLAALKVGDFILPQGVSEKSFGDMFEKMLSSRGYRDTARFWEKELAGRNYQGALGVVEEADKLLSASGRPL
jgi:hypothetical protein